MERIGLGGFFDAVSEGDNIIRSKLEPQVFVMLMEMLGLPTENVWWWGMRRPAARYGLDTHPLGKISGIAQYLCLKE